MAIVARELSFIKRAYQQIATILPNAGKRNLNLVFTTVARLSKQAKKIYHRAIESLLGSLSDNNGRDPHVKWSISARSSTYQPGGARCNLCLDEKLAILLADPPSTLSKRTELTGKCRHKDKFKLKNFS